MEMTKNCAHRIIKHNCYSIYSDFAITISHQSLVYHSRVWSCVVCDKRHAYMNTMYAGISFVNERNTRQQRSSSTTKIKFASAFQACVDVAACALHSRPSVSINNNKALPWAMANKSHFNDSHVEQTAAAASTRFTFLFCHHFHLSSVDHFITAILVSRRCENVSSKKSYWKYYHKIIPLDEHWRWCNTTRCAHIGEYSINKINCTPERDKKQNILRRAKRKILVWSIYKKKTLFSIVISMRGGLCIFCKQLKWKAPIAIDIRTDAFGWNVIKMTAIEPMVRSKEKSNECAAKYHAEEE